MLELSKSATIDPFLSWLEGSDEPAIKKHKYGEKLTPENMLWDLEANYLFVILTPAPEQRHANHCIRTVEAQNPKWYQDFCALYPSSRKGTKTRTRINRRETIKWLKRIIEGETEGVYVEKLLEFIRRS